MILKRHEAVPISASLATVVVERVFDGVVMLAFVFLNLPELANANNSSGFIGSVRDATIYRFCPFLWRTGSLPAGSHVSRGHREGYRLDDSARDTGSFPE